MNDTGQAQAQANRSALLNHRILPRIISLSTFEYPPKVDRGSVGYLPFRGSGFFVIFDKFQNNTINFGKIKLAKRIKYYVAESSIHGKGLFARERIESGTVIGWITGVPSDVDGSHVLWLSENEGIEVTCDLRYINHSDQPNACYYDDRSVVALTDIQPDDEITHNYSSNDW